MSADLQFLEEWIPEKMDPGTVFVLENQTKIWPLIAISFISSNKRQVV